MDVVAHGVQFHVQELGAGERTPVVMLHGLLVGTLAAWYFTAAPALAAERRVLLYDLRGHGRTERVRDGYDVATMARDLSALAGRLGGWCETPQRNAAELAEPPAWGGDPDGFAGGAGRRVPPRDGKRPGGGGFAENTALLGRVDVVGHSFGALVALRFALDHPEKVRRLVIVEAPLPPSRFDELEAFAARSPEQMIEALPPDLRAFLGQGGRRAARLLSSIRFLVEDTTMLASLRAEPDIADEALARLDRPVLCVYGDRSSCRGVGERLAAVIPGARLVVLPGGHYLHLDATVDLSRAILEFLDG